MYKKILFSLLAVAIGFLFNVFQVSAETEEEIKFIGDFNSVNLRTVNTSEGVKVYYTNLNDGNTLYVYEERTGSSRKLISHSTIFISPVETSEGVKVYYRNSSDGNSLYVYEESTGTSRKLTSHAITGITTVNTSEGVKVYYRNASVGGSLFVYEERTGLFTRLNTQSINFAAAINTSEGVKVYYVNSSDNNTLHVYEESTGASRKISNSTAQFISPVETSEGVKVYYRNGSSSGRLYVYEESTGSTRKLTDTVVQFTTAINTSEGVKVYYRNNSEAGFLHVYEEKTGLSRKLQSLSISDTSAVKTNEGIKVYYRVEANSTLWRYSILVVEVLEEVTSVISDIGHNYINLSWRNSDDERFQKVQLFKNGVMLSEIEPPNNSYKINDLIPNTNYEIKLISNYSSGSSEGVTLNLKTLEVREVASINTQIGYDFIYLSWINPSLDEFKKVLIYKDGQKIEEVVNPKNDHNITDLEPNTNYEIKLTTKYSTEYESEGITLNVRTGERIEEIKSLFTEISFNQIHFSWINPDIEELEKIILYDGEGVKIGETPATNNSFTVKNLKSNTEYEFLIKTKYKSGLESFGYSVVLSTMEVQYEHLKVKDLSATAKHNRVDLRWRNPDLNAFDFVRIYRKKEVVNENDLVSFFLGKKVFAENGYDPIFETNGTMFNDLTVSPETTYDYMLNSVTTEGEEVEGETIFVTTAEAPLPTMGGVNESTNENGDHVFTWSSPTDGQVKIFVGGTEYTTVDASLGQVVIPAEDMKYNMFNNPDVTLQPISANGKEGKKSSPGLIGGSWGNVFSANEFLKATMNFIMLVGPFVLLAIAVRFTPRIIKLIKQSLGNRRFKT